MKKNIIRICVLMIMACIISVTSFAATGKVKSNGVRVRAKATTNSSVVTS